MTDEPTSEALATSLPDGAASARAQTAGLAADPLSSGLFAPPDEFAVPPPMISPIEPLRVGAGGVNGLAVSSRTRSSRQQKMASVEVESVRLASDSDLAGFVMRVLRMCENPRRRDDIRAGRIRFCLEGTGHSGEDPALPAACTIRTGVVTERIVEQAANGSCRSITLGPGVVVTPLGRDRARRLGVSIEREN